MKKIYNIIDRELIFRTNNVQSKNEFGEVGISANITIDGTNTIFTTEYIIDSVNYVTVNGLNLIEGVHYSVTGKNTISIGNNGSPLKKNPSLTNTILVNYNNKGKATSSVKTPPILDYFTISPNQGQTNEIVMNFSISAYDGKNIYWSILKDGDSTPLFSGDSLKSSDGYSTTNGTSTKLSYFVSAAEYSKKQNQELTFTFVVIYDLSDDGSRLNEKIINSAKYKVLKAGEVTGSLSVSPSSISTVVKNYVYSVIYNINNVQDYPQVFDWVITKSTDNGITYTTVKSGNQSSADLSGTHPVTITTVAGQNVSTRYYLKIKKQGETAFSTIANDLLTISVPAAILVAHAGYLDAALMSYVDPADDTRKKIGSTGTPKDLAVYKERVPSTIFTKDIGRDYLTSGDFIAAYVETFGGTVNSVYFVIEVPDTWGPISFWNSIGIVNSTFFNTISLGNGYTAYLYKAGPSSVTTPSDYYLKEKQPNGIS